MLAQGFTFWATATERWWEESEEQLQQKYEVADIGNNIEEHTGATCKRQHLFSFEVPQSTSPKLLSEVPPFKSSKKRALKRGDIVDEMAWI